MKPTTSRGIAIAAILALLVVALVSCVAFPHDGAVALTLGNYAWSFMDGSERRVEELEALLRDGPGGGLEWSPATFIPFEDDVKSVTPLAELQNRLKALEDALPRTPQVQKQRQQVDMLISPYAAPEESQEMKELRGDISELKQQMAKVAELLYVHDQALRQIWEKGSVRK